MTPIEKNVIVVDENGNEYEATYPKRAKGLVKNGRARFIEENKICLVCPPNTNLEKKMEENKALTAREVFTQITELQRQLTENSQTSLHRLGDAIVCVYGDGDNGEADADIGDITGVFSQREQTLYSMLCFYQKMYDGIVNEDAKKVDLIKAAFRDIAATIEASDLETKDKLAALTDISDKIASFVEKVILE